MGRAAYGLAWNHLSVVELACVGIDTAAVYAIGVASLQRWIVMIDDIEM